MQVVFEQKDLFSQKKSRCINFFKKNKKTLAFYFIFCYNRLYMICFDDLQGGVYTWQSAIFAAKVLCSVLLCPTPTEELTEHGSLMLERLRRLLTVLRKQSTPAQDACVPARLIVQFNY